MVIGSYPILALIVVGTFNCRQHNSHAAARARTSVDQNISLWFGPSMFEGKPYTVLLFLCWIYALLRGGLPERAGATILVIGGALTIAAVPRWNYSQPIQPALFVIDVACMIAFTILALRADRFWPIWVSAFAGLGVLGHLARWYRGPSLDGWAYVVSLTIWSYPLLAAIAAARGTISGEWAATPRHSTRRGSHV